MTGAHHEEETGARVESERDGNSETGASNGDVASVRRLVRRIVAAWMVVVRAFSWFTARVVAVSVFAIGFVPYALVMRIIQFDPLDRDLDPDSKSYWSEPPATNRELDEFRKQY